MGSAALAEPAQVLIDFEDPIPLLAERWREIQARLREAWSR
jgi:hypothetical protein